MQKQPKYRDKATCYKWKKCKQENYWIPSSKEKWHTFNEEEKDEDKNMQSSLLNFRLAFKPTHVMQAHLLLLKLGDKNIYFLGNVAH